MFHETNRTLARGYYSSDRISRPAINYYPMSNYAEIDSRKIRILMVSFNFDNLYMLRCTIIIENCIRGEVEYTIVFSLMQFIRLLDFSPSKLYGENICNNTAI